MSVKIREKRGRLYLDVYHNGKRTWESLKISVSKDKAQNKEVMRVAEICRSKRELQLLTGAWDIQDPVAGKKELVSYLKEFSANYKSPVGVNNCIHHLKNYENGAVIHIDQVTPRWFEAFQKYLLTDAGLSQASAHLYICIIRGALKKAVADGLIQKSPAEGVKKISAQEIEQPFLNFDEVQRLASTPVEGETATEIRRAFLFACYTGLRVSDLETLTWGQIEKNPMQIIKQQEKTGNPVYVPLKETAQMLLIDGKDHEPAERVFAFSAETRSNTYRYLKQWVKKAGITKNVSWHTARRTFATMALEAGVDIYTVAKLIGHTGIDQVAKYAKVTDRLRRDAIAALPAIDLEKASASQDAEQNKQEA